MPPNHHISVNTCSFLVLGMYVALGPGGWHLISSSAPQLLHDTWQTYLLPLSPVSHH